MTSGYYSSLLQWVLINITLAWLLFVLHCSIKQRVIHRMLIPAESWLYGYFLNVNNWYISHVSLIHVNVETSDYIFLSLHCNNTRCKLSTFNTDLSWSFILYRIIIFSRSYWTYFHVIFKYFTFFTVFSGVRVTRSLVLCVCFVDRCLSFFLNIWILITPLVSSKSS